MKRNKDSTARSFQYAGFLRERELFGLEVFLIICCWLVVPDLFGPKNLLEKLNVAIEVGVDLVGSENAVNPCASLGGSGNTSVRSGTRRCARIISCPVFDSTKSMNNFPALGRGA